MKPILQKTSAIVDTLISALQNAEREVILQTFYFDNDIVGKKFLEALIHKTAHGVKVTCLFDALGARGLSGSKEEKQAIAAGVHIEYFNWLTPWSIRNKRSWFFRNHKRVLIIDEKSVHIGGWCIGKKSSDWIDSNIEITNPHVIHRALADFKNMHKFAKKRTLKFQHEKRFTYSLEADHTHQYAYQAPLLRARHIYYTYIKLIKSANKEIVLIAPYFVPGRRLVREMLKAKRRGVDIHIYLPKYTDYRTVDIAARTFFTKLLRYNIRIHLCSEMLHAKVSVFDDTVFVGSLNLDNVSLRYNFENGVFVRDAGLLTQIHADVEYLKTTSTQVDYTEWQRRSWWDKLLERIVGVVKGLL